MSSYPIVGAYTLKKPLASGGMGVVWLGEHIKQREAVAIKLLPFHGSIDPEKRAAFFREIQAVSALNHRHVVHVYDYGHLNKSHELASGGHLVADTPYMVMELANPDSPLLTHPPQNAETLLNYLVPILEGLSHAHARGITHRDLKPSNILQFGREKTLKLVDFGLAQIFSAPEGLDQHSSSGGTPRYMAPEQFESRNRDCGPWTDLYSLACFVWEWVSGQPVFSNRSLFQLIHAHLHEPPPPLNPQFPVPKDFEAWLRKNLAKDFRTRFPAASDALNDLLHLFGTDRRGRSRSLPKAPLSESGLNLVGLRHIPLVGRAQEREVLRDLFATVAQNQKPHLVLLDGPAGVGKTKLAEWLGEDLEELGHGQALRVQFNENPAPMEGLAQAIHKKINSSGLEGLALLNHGKFRLAGLLENENAWLSWVEWLAPGSMAGANPLWRPLQPHERYAFMIQCIAHFCQSKPVVVLLDNLHWGADGLLFLREFFSEFRQLPVLFVGTVRSEGLINRPQERFLLEQVQAEIAPTVLHLGPLTEKEHQNLLHQLIPLNPELHSRLLARTSGNPLFTLRLIGDWIQRGLLVPSETGFALSGLQMPELPDNLHQIWRDYLARALKGQPESSWFAVELAAFLGSQFNVGTWDEVCQVANIPNPPSLVERLQECDLWISEPSGFRFAHDMLRESVERQAIAAGRHQRWHGFCAQVLLKQRDKRGIAEKLAYHFQGADQPHQAIEFFLVAAREQRETSGYASALYLLERRESLIDTLGRDSMRNAWVEGRILMARVHLHQGRLNRTMTLAQSALIPFDPPVAEDLICEAMRLVGDVQRKMNQLNEALDTYRACIKRSENIGQDHALAASAWGLADCQRRCGLLNEVTQSLECARAAYERIADAHGIADYWIGKADLCLCQGENQAAELGYQQAMQLFEELGNRYGVARSMNGLACLDFAHNRRELAFSRWEKALEMLNQLGSREQLYPLLNLIGKAKASQIPKSQRRSWASQALRLAKKDQRADLRVWILHHVSGPTSEPQFAAECWLF